jgi:hypothetical protein
VRNKGIERRAAGPARPMPVAAGPEGADAGRKPARAHATATLHRLYTLPSLAPRAPRPAARRTARHCPRRARPPRAGVTRHAQPWSSPPRSGGRSQKGASPAIAASRAGGNECMLMSYRPTPSASGAASAATRPGWREGRRRCGWGRTWKEPWSEKAGSTASQQRSQVARRDTQHEPRALASSSRSPYSSKLPPCAASACARGRRRRARGGARGADLLPKIATFASCRGVQLARSTLE